MKNYDLTKGNINKLLLSFSIPCIISLLINPIYNMIDQIFIGKGLGLVESNATNIIFPLVLIFSSLSIIIGNGTSTELSLKLKMGREDEAKKIVGSSISCVFLFSIILSLVLYIIFPKLVYLFGATTNGYSYALDYGHISILGFPFMMLYTTLFSIIRTDGSLKYSMVMVFSGSIINIILNIIFIFGFNMGVKGCALATLIGQLLSFLLALSYLPKMKRIKLNYKDYKPNYTFLHVLSLELPNFINHMMIVIIFIFINHIMIRCGTLSKYGMDIPLGAHGILSKMNCLFIFLILGVSTGMQSIIGFYYGAGKKDKVQLVLHKVLKINFIIGMFVNFLLIVFPEPLLNLFITKSDPNYNLFMELSILMCHISLMLCSLKFIEITMPIVIQSFGKSIKAMIILFIRPCIMLFIIIFMLIINSNIYGILYSFLITDIICFLIYSFLFVMEYKNLKCPKDKRKMNINNRINNLLYSGRHLVVTISREYGSGGHYVGKLLANRLGLKFYDEELISMAAKESGLSEWYVEETEQRLSSSKFLDNNDDRLFIAESKIIQGLAKKESCVIVGRCADYILKEEPNVIKIFLYSDHQSKINRAILYYNVDSSKAEQTIIQTNDERARHYKYYTSHDWADTNNYDLMINVDQIGVEATVVQIVSYINQKRNINKER